MKQTEKKVSRTALNLGLDATVFVAFLVTTAPRFSGIAIHEWLSIAFGAAIVTHLLLHWQWIIATTKRFFHAAMRGHRLNYVLNALLFISMTVIIFTGLVISQVALPTVGIATVRGGIWRQLHSLATDFTVFVLGVHVALHWTWIISTLKRFIVKPALALFSAKQPVPAPVRAQQEVQR
jgi:hypothetical protein